MAKKKNTAEEPSSSKAKSHKVKTGKKADETPAVKKKPGRKKKADVVPATRVCRVCGKEKTLDEFNYWNKEKQTYMDICKECEREKNREKHERKRELLNELKASGCVICGETEACCLDFHHIDQEHKEFNMGSAMNKTDKKIIEEAAKCVIVCANCHRKIHAGVVDVFDHVSKNQYTYYRMLVRMSQANAAAQILSNSAAAEAARHQDAADSDRNENG